MLRQILVRLGHGFRVHLQRNIDCRVTFVLGLRLSAFRGPISRSQIVAVPVTSTESTRILSTSVVQTARPMSSHSGAKMKALGPILWPRTIRSSSSVGRFLHGGFSGLLGVFSS